MTMCLMFANNDDTIARACFACVSPYISLCLHVFSSATTCYWPALSVLVMLVILVSGCIITAYHLCASVMALMCLSPSGSVRAWHGELYHSQRMPSPRFFLLLVVIESMEACRRCRLQQYHHQSEQHYHHQCSLSQVCSGVYL